MKKGFTLVELIGVIIILGVIGLLAFPPIINSIKNSKKELSEATKELIYSATELYVDKYKDQYSKKPGKAYCVSLKDLASNDLIKSPITDSVTGKEIDLNKQVQVTVSNQSYEYSLPDTCVMGPNEPNLSSNMIPIEHDGTNWVKADTSQEWYNYDKQEWANAVTVTASSRGTYKSAPAGTVIAESDILTYMVWIPRYKYKLFNANNGSIDPQQIEIIFESGTNSTGTVKCIPAISATDTGKSENCTDAANGSIINGTSTYTHPAFTFGEDQLGGFWVGKFETTGTISTPCTTETCTTANLTIKPNLPSVRNQIVSSMYYASRSMSAVNNNIYGYDTTTDTHMMKNMEWGAVAYLKQSKYGLGTTNIGINNNSNYTMGCGSPAGSAESSTCNAYNTTNGMLASTTGNIYGVYDMNGGAYEYVMGNMVDSNGAFQSSEAGFTATPDSKYYDSYTYGTTATNSTAHARGLLGDATKETLKAFGGGGSAGWYSDNSAFVYSTAAWFIRGGYYIDMTSAGAFNFYRLNGGSHSNRSWRLTCR